MIREVVRKVRQRAQDRCEYCHPSGLRISFAISRRSYRGAPARRTDGSRKSCPLLSSLQSAQGSEHCWNRSGHWRDHAAFPSTLRPMERPFRVDKSSTDWQNGGWAYHDSGARYQRSGFSRGPESAHSRTCVSTRMRPVPNQAWKSSMFCVLKMSLIASSRSPWIL